MDFFEIVGEKNVPKVSHNSNGHYNIPSKNKTPSLGGWEQEDQVGRGDGIGGGNSKWNS